MKEKQDLSASTVALINCTVHSSPPYGESLYIHALLIDKDLCECQNISDHVEKKVPKYE